MPVLHHTQLFFQNPLNVSVQEGDFVYFAKTQNASQSGTGTQFQINNNNMNEVGEIVYIFSTPTYVTNHPAVYDPVTNLITTPAYTTGIASNNSIVCKFYCDDPATDCLDWLPDVDDLIMFSKDNAANMTSILGYYAEVEMVNDSNEKAKLFAVSADATESSK